MDAEAPKQQALHTAHDCHRLILLVDATLRRERACLVILINTASERSISTSHDPKVANLSVLYGCDRLASFGRREPLSLLSHIVAFCAIYGRSTMAQTGVSGLVVVDGESFLDALFASAGQG